MSRKGLSVRTEPNMTLADLERLKSMHLCKSNLLEFVNGFSDPIGIASPWYMKLKLLMKKLFELEEQVESLSYEVQPSTAIASTRCTGYWLGSPGAGQTLTLRRSLPILKH